MRIRKQSDELLQEEILLISRVSDALAHPARVKMFKYIMDMNRQMTSVCNKNLVEEFGYAQATVSQHMAILVSSGLVEGKKDKKFTYFFANLGMLAKYLNATKKFSID